MTSFISQIFGSRSSKSVNVPAVQIYDVEDAVEKPGRSLKHLLKLNHAEHALHNNTPISGLSISQNNVAHALISAFLFGANENDLNSLYESESKTLGPWKDSPGEVVGVDWRDYLGKKEYQRAFLDFFEDQLAEEGYDWKSVLHKFLFTGEGPLISSITASAGQPLTHLAYGLKMSSSVVVMEALTLAATCYHDNDISKYSDDPSYFQQEPSYRSSSILEILAKVRTDTRFCSESLAVAQEQNLEVIFRDREAALLDHCNAWAISSDPVTDFHASQAAAAAIATGIESGVEDGSGLLYPLIMSHAILVLLPHTPKAFHISLLRQWWLMTLAIYIAQLRPEIQSGHVAAYNVHEKDWQWVSKQAISGPHAKNAQFVKGLHALKEIDQAWKDSDEYYLKAAVLLINKFHG
ncbi:hypothetical protein BGW36DRAFT_430086 [Talaromyces proteolyticus]|uniref:MGS207 protein n=1 Tax=Talaromyces proteolyticus TaxID=1131652 RepID=A0AAD4KL41_9EURO|nr:uncharacterized protein BGW36DRAFT_430086 [Talaromyces proteolyticus]KAH8694062.1 hypothetical protein BGW36DRAFT_430086 [Talaromyces proteolyticus]